MAGITIVTICYNAQACIESTLRSIDSQTEKDFEYLIIDGASKDNTLDLVRKITPYARIVSEPDHGIYDAMNKGLAYAKGDYVWFMNAGDRIYSPETLSKISKLLDSKPDILYGDTMIVGDHGEELGLRRLRPPKELSWKCFKNGMLVCHQAFIVKKTLAPEYDTSYRFSADFDWCIKCLKSAGSVVNSNLVLARYLKEGATTRNHRASLKERFRIMSKYYGFLPTVFKHISFLFVRKR